MTVHSAQSDQQGLALSRYVVASEAFVDCGSVRVHRLVLATRSGRIFRFDAALWEDLCKGRFSGVPAPAIERLIEANLLVRDRTGELAEVLRENDAAISKTTRLYQVIQPSAFCQLGCTYCGQTHSRRRLDEANQKGILERIERKFRNRRYELLHVGWFGAEPLAGLASLRALSPCLKEIASRHGADYSAHIVTNGVKLDVATARELATEHNVHSAEITLDGPAREHDARRFFKTGGPSFDRILANLIDVARQPDLPLALRIRCNVDARNAHSVEQLIDILADAGLAGRINVYFAPIHDWGNAASDLALAPETYARNELDWAVYAMSRGFSMGLLPTRKKIVCMAVQPDSEVIDAYGNIFNCTETPYVDAYGSPNRHRIGTLQHDDVNRSVNRFGVFNADVADGSYGCSKCPMLPVCGGACPKSWNEGQAACPSFKHNMPDRLLVAHALSKLVDSLEELECSEEGV
ncbi:radical SAM protein [Ensifer sp. NBAIM29]|nr:radical SAM protein [Ensifer sp. NBAIM29]